MKIVINTLTITNFKGIKNLVVSFQHITDIFGENAAGKSTVFDAFTWLFFDKDSSNRSDFEIKPLDKHGNASKKVDVEVSAEIQADGKTIEIKKILREKWTKKKGEAIAEFTGNENLYFWNDVPLQLKQYKEKVNDLLNENIFKLITNPLHFNSLKWQERRSILLDIAGAITNEELVAVNPDFSGLIKLLGDKSLEEFKKEMSAKKKKLKTELEAIPTRIDEISRNLPEEIDFDALRAVVEQKVEDLANIDAALQDSTKVMQEAYEAKRKQQNDLHALKTKSENIKAGVRSTFAEDHSNRKQNIANLESNLRNLNTNASNKKQEIENAKASKSNYEKELDDLRNQWVEVDNEALKFGENQFDCPACKRPLEADKIATAKEDLTSSFNTNKANRLNAISDNATRIKTIISGIDQKLESLNAEYTSLQNDILQKQPQLIDVQNEHNRITANAENEFNDKLAKDAAYQNALAEIKNMEATVEEEVKVDDNSELKKRKADLQIEIDGFKRQLTDEDRINQSKTRIEQLQAEETNLAQQMADMEGNEYLAEQFTKAKMDTLVSRINGRFKYVTFKMFNILGNGGEEEACDTLVDGVPFPDANTASKINAGIDIINTLCEHYGVYAPIFIDNRESVNNLIECNSQIVNLIVSKDKKLRVA